MAIEYRPEVDALDKRLATLADPELAEQLLENNPSLYVRTLAQREKEARKRLGLWGVSLAGTALVSVAVGVFAGTSILRPFASAHPKQQQAVAGPPHSATLPRHRALAIPPHHVASHHAATVAVPKAEPRHVAPTVDEALIQERRAQQAQMRRLEARVAAEEAAARRAQAEAQAAAHAASLAHHAAEASAAAAAPAAHPATRPATGTSTQGSTATSTETSTATSTSQTTAQPLPDAPPPTTAGTKTGPPQGSWTEHWPAGAGPVVVGRDPCTPSGGRIGSVLQSAATQIIGHGIMGGRF